MRLYESVILLLLMYGAELWLLTATLSERLDAAHHRWQRSILGICWKDKVTNEEVKKRTGQQSLVNTISDRRLDRLGHIIKLDHQRIPQQAIYWEVPSFKRGPGRPRANWRGVVKKDLQRMRLTCEEAEVAALARQERCRNVAEFVHMDGQR